MMSSIALAVTLSLQKIRRYFATWRQKGKKKWEENRGET
ncbi:hypothetical protein JCM19240_188 [Vibrio maritimus]|uniref:Uncharacterized protein n=1 Tax=Vibrio maritimus TaxID=990268 RepID=A0A090TCS5_9VIBR|nr:hypothetical protein JCM19240_188 [Vibrio maritimus]